MRTILILAANRKRSVHLRLDEEGKPIGQRLERTKERARFNFQAVRSARGVQAAFDRWSRGRNAVRERFR